MIRWLIGILLLLPSIASAERTLVVDVDPTLGPPTEPVVDMTKWDVDIYDLGAGEYGVRIYQRDPDGSANAGHHEIRKIVNFDSGDSVVVDDLATVPILPLGGVVTGQLPSYWSGIFSSIPGMTFQPDMPHNFYIDTSSIPEGSQLFNSLVDIMNNFNAPATGYESVMTDDIINIATYVGNGDFNNPVYPAGFDASNFRNSIILLDPNTPGTGTYNFASKTMGFRGGWTNATLKEELGSALFPGALGTIHSGFASDLEVLDYDRIALRVPYTTDVQGPSGETQFILFDSLYTPNSSDGSGAFPGDLPAELLITEVSLDANGTAIVDLDQVTDAPPTRTPALHQNTPNPFNPTTTIAYTTSLEGHVTLKIYDLSGRHVATLVDESMPAGEYSATWNGTDASGAPVSSGTYLYELVSGDYRQTKKMVLVR